MQDGAERHGWREWFSVSADAMAVIGGLGTAMSIILWLLRLPSPFPLILGCIFGTLLFVGILGHISVSNNQPLESIGEWLNSPQPRSRSLAAPPSIPLPMHEARTDSVRIIPDVQPESNIVLRWDDSDNYFRIARDPNQPRTFRNSPNVRRFNAAIVQFRNQPKPPQKLGRATNVMAEVLYYEADNPEVIDLRTSGCWLNTPSPTVSFDLDSSQYLMLGFFRKFDGGYQFEIFDSGETDEDFCVQFGSFSPYYKIVVRLSWGEHREFGIEESFELTTEYGEHSKVFELSHLTGEVDDNNRPIKRTRGRVSFA